VEEHWKPISRKGGLLKVRDKRTGKIRYGFITTIHGVKYQKTCFLNEKDAEHALAALKLRRVLEPVEAPPRPAEGVELSITHPNGNRKSIRDSGVVESMNAPPAKSAELPRSQPSGKRESLSDYVQRVRNERGFSLLDVELNSGRRISNTYVSRIENGHVTNPTRAKLQALARGLRVSPQEMYEVAFGTQVKDEDEGFRKSALFLLYQKLIEARPEKRRLVEAMIEMILNDLDTTH